MYSKSVRVLITSCRVQQKTVNQQNRGNNCTRAHAHTHIHSVTYSACLDVVQKAWWHDNLLDKRPNFLGRGGTATLVHLVKSRKHALHRRKKKHEGRVAFFLSEGVRETKDRKMQ